MATPLPAQPPASRTSTPGPITLDVKKWQDFVDYGEFNRLFLQHARTSLKAGRTAEQAMAELKPPRSSKATR